MLASIILGTRFFFNEEYRQEIRKLDRSWWRKLTIYGILYYTTTQGTQFVGLFYLPAITVSFMLNLTSLLVLVLAILFLNEYPSLKQIVLLGVGLVGIVLYFYPVHLPWSQLFGLGIVFLGVLANALSSVLGRSLNQDKEISPSVITTISMMIGSIILLLIALIIEGLPILTIPIVILILWLAVVNTAIAFVIWNYTLQELTAVESSVINSSMLPQITILAMLFFGERLILKEWIGLTLIFFTGLLISFLRDTDQITAKAIDQEKKEK